MRLVVQLIKYLWYGFCLTVTFVYLAFLRAALTGSDTNNLVTGIYSLAITLLIFACFQIAKLLKR